MRVQQERCLLKEAAITAGHYANKVHAADMLLVKWNAVKAASFSETGSLSS